MDLVDDRGSSQGATAWVLGVTVSYIVLGGVGFRQRMSTEIAALLVAVGLGLSGVTLALALDGPALVVGWSAEAVILAWGDSPPALRERPSPEEAAVVRLTRALSSASVR